MQRDKKFRCRQIYRIWKLNLIRLEVIYVKTSSIITNRSGIDYITIVIMFFILLAARKDGTRPLKFNQYGNKRINKNSRV